MPNPVLNDRAFSSYHNDLEFESNQVMTSTGAILKTAFLGIVMALTFGYTWFLQMNGFTDKIHLLQTIGFIGSLVMVFVIVFAPKNNFLILTTSVYALFEGLLLGSVSAEFNQFIPGIVPQAALATILTVITMAVLYLTRIIKCTDKMRATIYISTTAIFFIYLLQAVLLIFHIQIPGLFSNSPIGIAISAIFTIVAAFNLILDFDFIERFSERIPKYFEWYAGFSLMVTIIWIYVRMLDLIAKITTRNN